MADQQKRTQPVTPAERLSPADRVKQVQQIERAQAVEQVRTVTPTSSPRLAALNSVASETVGQVRVPTTFHVPSAKPVSLNGARRREVDQASYGKAQMDHAALFGGPAADIEVTGNPWKIIDFSAYLPMTFDAPRPLEQYEAQLPAQAAKTDQGLLFQVGLRPKDGQGPTLRRHVLASESGQLLGAECRSTGELSRLLGKAPSVAQQLYQSAFDDGGVGARIVKVAPSRQGAYEVTVGRGDQLKLVQVNNFGRPLEGPNKVSGDLDPADFFLDKFSAAVA